MRRSDSNARRRRLREFLLGLLLGGLAAGALLALVLHLRATGSPALERAGDGSTRRMTSQAGEGSARHVSARSRNASPLLPGAAASFGELQVSSAGPMELALVPAGSMRVQAFGGERTAYGWSTTKVPVLTALLDARGASGLTPTEQGWAREAITESSNEAILDLFGDLERLKGGLLGASEAVEAELRASGDTDTVVATAPPPPGAVTRFGQTDWRPAQAALFFSALDRGCLVSPSATRYLLGLMQEIEPSEGWGLGSAGFDHVAFKGGWGPEGAAYLVRQSGIVDPGTAGAVAVAIVAYPPPGPDSFAIGIEMLTSAARWLHRELRSTGDSVLPCSAR